MRYDFFHILYRPSDPPGYEDRDMHKCGMVECYVASNMKTILPQNFRECELSQASLEDETCHVLKNLISSEWLVKVSELSPELKRLYQVCDSFTLYGNIFMNKPHLFIPEWLRNKYLKLCQKAIKVLLNAIDVPDKFSGGRDIKEFVAKCDIYTKFSRIKHQSVEDQACDWAVKI